MSTFNGGTSVVSVSKCARVAYEADGDSATVHNLRQDRHSKCPRRLRLAPTDDAGAPSVGHVPRTPHGSIETAPPSVRLSPEWGIEVGGARRRDHRPRRRSDAWWGRFDLSMGRPGRGPRMVPPRRQWERGATSADISSADPNAVLDGCAVAIGLICDTRAFRTLTTLVPPLKVDTLEAVPGPQTIASLIAPHLIQDDFAKIDELPLIVLPASSPSRLMAIFFSGDGGWRDIDKTIGENLQSLGVSVIGWDSVRYFWTKKTPKQTASDLSSVLLAYSAKWHADRVALIGFSFGADIIPSVYNRLRQSLKERVPMLSLLSPEPAADWGDPGRSARWALPPSAGATPLGRRS